MAKKKIYDFTIIFGFFLLPIILYLRPVNLAQTSFQEFFYLLISQVIILLFVLTLSLILHTIFLNKIFFNDFFILNSFTLFLLFYYKKLNLLFEKIDQSKLFVFNEIKISLLDNLLVLCIYFFIYYIFFKLFKNYNKKVKQFLFLVIILNFIFFFINSLSKFDTNKSNLNVILDKKDISENLKNINFEKTKKKKNIVIIVLDGMINLEKAEKELLISSQKNFMNYLSDYGFSYNKDFKSNYSNTYLSITSLLTGNYPVTPKSPKYTNRSNFFPNIMTKTDNFFYRIINELNLNFWWIGNYWGPCIPNLYTKCLTAKNKLSFYLAKVSRMYDDSIFRYFFISYFNKFPFEDSYKLLSNSKNFFKSLMINDSNSFIFMHLMKPHPPYDLDENCSKTNTNKSKAYIDRKKYYSYNYKCALQSSLKWSNEFVKLNKKNDNLIIILGDHGWNFNPNNYEFEESEDKNFYQNRLNSIFFAYLVPDRCQKSTPPASQVNVMRYVLNCIYNTKLEYLDDDQYITRYETHPDFGRVYNFRK
jgi:hypothetical protein